MADATAKYISAVSEYVGQSVFGVSEMATGLAMARIAAGHVLLQGPPGVGKTLLAKAFANVLGGKYRRIQGTPDLLPSDIIGVTIFQPDGREFEFREGPLFADVVLMDEINRCGPKTQSALLEAMEERSVSVEGQARSLPNEFVVLATQNPLDFEGTYPLPESQIDRFLLRLEMNYAAREDEARVLTEYARVTGAHQSLEATAQVGEQALSAARAECDACRVEDELVGYVLDIAAASRHSEQVLLGLSTRGARALLLMARISACANGFDFVRPDDVQQVAPWVIDHRLVLTPESALEGLTVREVCAGLLDQVPVPRLAQAPVESAAGSAGAQDRLLGT